MSKKLPKITIAIDGFSSTGKSTVAKQLAKELGYVYVDTGAMYRAITLYAMQQSYINEQLFDTNKLVNSLKNITLEFRFNNNLGFAEVYLNAKNVENKIRSIAVSSFVSRVAEVSEVRAFLVNLQRKMGKDKGVVMDGRDIGSVVFPEAELKVFLIADAKVRAERRFLEMQENGDAIDFETIYNNVVDRDHIDSNRKDSPLVKVSDAIEVDATFINKEEQFNLILSLAHKAIIKRLSKDSLPKKTK